MFIFVLYISLSLLRVVSSFPTANGGEAPCVPQEGWTADWMAQGKKNGIVFCGDSSSGGVSPKVNAGSPPAPSPSSKTSSSGSISTALANGDGSSSSDSGIGAGEVVGTGSMTTSSAATSTTTGSSSGVGSSTFDSGSGTGRKKKPCKKPGPGTGGAKGPSVGGNTASPAPDPLLLNSGGESAGVNNSSSSSASSDTAVPSTSTSAPVSETATATDSDPASGSDTGPGLDANPKFGPNPAAVGGDAPALTQEPKGSDSSSSSSSSSAGPPPSSQKYQATITSYTDTCAKDVGACGFIGTPTSFHCAMSEFWTSAGMPGQCGTCWRLSNGTMANPDGSLAATTSTNSITVMTTNTCAYYSGDPTGSCSQSKEATTDRWGSVVGVDLCKFTGASKAFWGEEQDSHGGIAVATIEQVDCETEWQGELAPESFADWTKFQPKGTKSLSVKPGR